MSHVVTISQHRPLPFDAVRALRDGLATCQSTRRLSMEARHAIASLCRTAHASEWSMEQLLIAVKEACYTSEEISRLTTTSEREALVSTIVTACIQEFYAPLLAD
jgi:hypothetical protein